MGDGCRRLGPGRRRVRPARPRGERLEFPARAISNRPRGRGRRDPAPRLRSTLPKPDYAGAILFVLKNVGSAQSIGRLVGADNLSATEAPASGYAMFGQIDFEHPLFAPFADPRFSDFTKIHFWKHRQLQTDRLSGARIL